MTALQQEGSSSLAPGLRQKRVHEAQCVIRRQEEQIESLRCENDRLRDAASSDAKVCCLLPALPSAARQHKPCSEAPATASMAFYLSFMQDRLKVELQVAALIATCLVAQHAYVEP